MTQVDLHEVMRQIREKADQRRREHPEIEQEIRRLRGQLEPAGGDPDFRELSINLRSANLQHSPSLPPATRFALVKRAALYLIRPFTRGQVDFNGSVVRTLNKAWEILQQQHKALEAAQQENLELHRRLQKLQQEQADTVELVRTQSDIFYDRQSEPALVEAARIYRESPDWQARAVAARALHAFRNEPPAAGLDSLQFQTWFFGSELETREQRRGIVPLFEHREPILDLGCGRGELLELLRERKISATGVESDPALARHSGQKGLAVFEADPLVHLAGLANGSLQGIFASQLLQRLPWDLVLELLVLASRKLGPGGLLVLKDMHPGCLANFTGRLYLDPRTVRPYHPESLELLCRNLGFVRSEVRLQPAVHATPTPPGSTQLSPSPAGSVPDQDPSQTAADYLLLAYK